MLLSDCVGADLMIGLKFYGSKMLGIFDEEGYVRLSVSGCFTVWEFSGRTALEK